VLRTDSQPVLGVYNAVNDTTPPQVRFVKSRSFGALNDNDYITEIVSDFVNDNSEVVTGLWVRIQVTDVSDGTEDVRTSILTQSGGTLAERFVIDDGGDIEISGDLDITGALSKGSGTFLIDHPLDPTNKDLYHAFVEAPRYDLVYRGQATLSNGIAVVDLDAASNLSPGTFEALTHAVEAQVWLQNDTGWESIRGVLSGSTLTIECQNDQSADTVSWLVIVERADAYIKSVTNTDAEGRLIPEHDKTVLPQAKLEALLADRERSDIESVQTEAVTEVAGKRGYPRHYEALGFALPERTVHPAPGMAPGKSGTPDETGV